LRTDAENVLSGRIQAGDQEVGIEQNNAGTQAIQDAVRLSVDRAAIAGTALMAAG
jgi:hypothetical protein